jgi:hypothetical protein
MTAQDKQTPSDPLAAFDERRRASFAAVADYLIPEAHGMPSARDIVDDVRLRFVLRARPDLIEPFQAALGEQFGDNPSARLTALERDEPDQHAALLLVVVGGYYTDQDVRDRLGYPGQVAKPVNAWQYPDYLEEGLIDPEKAQKPIWRDPSTGRPADEG